MCVPFALQQLTEHVLIPGHDAHVQGSPADEREEGQPRTGAGQDDAQDPPFLHQCLFASWQTAFQNHDQGSKNENGVASMSPLNRWPKGQEPTKGRDA